MNALAAIAAQATAPAVVVERVCKSFVDPAGMPLAVLEDISFALNDGEIVALLGTSGCGKSTLLNIMAGLQEADAGTVTVAGGAVTRHSPPILGYVFQDDRLLPWRTALRNVTFSLEAGSARRAERDARARKVLDLMNLTAFADAYPHQLSGGMRSRVALARSLVLDPRIMLMDEPFGRLDAQTRAQMHTEVLRIKELLGMSIIFVTHDVDEAVVLADRVLVFAPRPGRIKAQVDIKLPRPRDPTSVQAASYIRELKGYIG
jgi:ABC-type nitrate/sulfonate/bicarbonate transport system ATPase subunit